MIADSFKKSKGKSEKIHHFLQGRRGPTRAAGAGEAGKYFGAAIAKKGGVSYNINVKKAAIELTVFTR